MNQELHYVHHPIRTKLYWMAFYLGVFLFTVFGLYAVAGQIRTRTLPVGQVELSVPYSKYAVGENISFTVKNKFNSPAYVINKCPSEPLGVYRFEQGQWLRIHDSRPTADCAGLARQVLIPPNGSVTESFDAWPNLFTTPGKYRVVLLVENYKELPYQDFEVVAKPADTASSAPSQQAQTTAATASATQSKTLTFRQGTINVQYTGSTIYLISVIPSPGYGYESNGTVGPVIEVTFKGGQEMQVQLFLQGGQLNYRVEGD